MQSIIIFTHAACEPARSNGCVPLPPFKKMLDALDVTRLKRTWRNFMSQK
jgi:hypothetical protein